MAKVSKPKRHEPSVHSRSHRRNATPPTEVARSKSKPEEPSEHWMYNAQNAGVSKKSKTKKLTHAQRVRQSKALERAERNMDVLEKKVSESKQKGRKIQARAKDWDELNGALAVEAPTVEEPVQVDAEVEVVDTAVSEDNNEASLATEMQVSHDLQTSAVIAESKNKPADEVDIIT